MTIDLSLTARVFLGNWYLRKGGGYKFEHIPEFGRCDLLNQLSKYSVIDIWFPTQSRKEWRI